jgi:hypothetical protein
MSACSESNIGAIVHQNPRRAPLRQPYRLASQCQQRAGGQLLFSDLYVVDTPGNVLPDVLDPVSGDVITPHNGS